MNKKARSVAGVWLRAIVIAFNQLNGGRMSKTNIERFDEMSADVLAFLYDNFPISQGLSPKVAGLTELVYLDYDPTAEEAETIGERDPETEFFESTVDWLVQSGFIAKKNVPVNSFKYSLTAYGLQALKHVPLPSIGEGTLGEQLSEAAKGGLKSTASALMNQVVTIGTGLMLRHYNVHP